MGGLVYVSKCIISINHLNRANILSIIFVRDLRSSHDLGTLRSRGATIVEYHDPCTTFCGCFDHRKSHEIQWSRHVTILIYYDHVPSRSYKELDHRSPILGLLLFLSWVPIYLFYTTSTDLLDDISRRETKYATDEHTLFYEAFDSLTPLVAKAEIILNWFVLIKFTLIIIAVKGTS